MARPDRPVCPLVLKDDFQSLCQYINTNMQKHTHSGKHTNTHGHRKTHALFLITCYFVSNKFTRLNLPDATKQTLELFLSHVLRQIVDYQVGFTVLYAPRLHRGGAVVWDGGGTVARVVARRPVGQLCFHGSNYLLKRHKEFRVRAAW